MVEGTLYPLLTRLCKAKLLDYRWEESNSGPPRKYFTLTSHGKMFLEKLNDTWDGLIDSTNQIINKPVKAEAIADDNTPEEGAEPLQTDNQ